MVVKPTHLTSLPKKSSGTDCNTGCSVTYNNPTSDITVAAGLTACITGTIGSNVKLTLGSNSKVKICASGTFKEAIISSGAEFYILENATVRINKFTNGYSYFNVYNWSDSVVIDSTTGYSFAPNLMDNYGKIYTPRFGVGTRVRNYGKLVVTGDFSIGAYSTMQNDGFFKVTGNMEIGTLSDFFNNCRIEVGVNLTQQGYFYHNGYVKVGETFIHTTPNTEWPNGTALYSGSLISTKNFLLGYGGIGGNNSFIKVSNTTTITGGSMNLSTFCDINGIETKTGGDISGAILSCSGYLSTSTCNPEGFGSQSTTDTDNDGIVNAYDEYPNDATRAFNSFYPNASTTATVAFEDLWPAKADYDFNDLALAFNIQQVLNANNEVVEYKVKMRVKAIGGSYVNGFGFQLDELVPSDIASITGQVLTQNLITRNANNTEAGQSKAVIICYDSPEPTLNRVGGSMFNTVKTNGTGSSDSIRINIVFSTPQAASKLTFTKFNPFIFTNKRRGYEIHMANYRPTDLANTNLFGTFDDRTNPINNEFYKTTNGMPWAILIPENFVYPIEKTPITSGYNFFDDWAISGGSGYTNWYNNSPGNRNTNVLY
ncbi:LruC domain-containing protein [Oscillatoria amoena NRMC-F 0135]|nr:LruC domain-containing protein [Oscillatoria amoena NRMC-F 0135]